MNTPLESSQEDALPVVWMRVKTAVRTRGLSRSMLYELMNSGAIVSRSLRKRGNTRGTRLIHAESLDQYIWNQQP